MIPAYFITIDRARPVINVDFAFQARLIEWHVMFGEVLAAAGSSGISRVFIDCRTGIKPPLPGELNRYARSIKANARAMTALRIAILIRTNDPVTDKITSMLRDGWAKLDYFRDEKAAHDWLERPATRTRKALPARFHVSVRQV